MTGAALEVRDLTVTYETGGAPVQAVRGVDLRVQPEAALGIVGESGSGKTSIALATSRLLPDGAHLGGSVRVGGRELVGASAREVRRVRWREVASVIQAPGRGLNPVRRIRGQFTEVLRLHLDVRGRDAVRRADHLAEQVSLDPALLDRYPHQLSGGQQQRVMLALALSCDPRVLVLDEPTSGLDAAGKQDLLETLARLRRERGLAMLLISHDLPAIAHLTDEVAVLYAGMVMERGDTTTVFGDPRHPYTRDLVSCFPVMTTHKDLRGIRGTPPDPTAPPSGCPYHPRCTQAIAECSTWEPQTLPVAHREVTCVREGLVERISVSAISRSFRLPGGRRVEALRGVDLILREGEVLGIVGETGSGKSTLARILLGLTAPDAGVVRWEGRDLASFTEADRRGFHRGAAIVYQDPYEAISHRFTVARAVREPLDVQGDGDRDERAARVSELLDAVGLPTDAAFLARPAHELSGGQLQRVAVARALALAPRLLVADEPTSMLDASEQARLLSLLRGLQVAHGLALIFVSHDLALVRKLADRLLVLDAGAVVEEGPAHRVVTEPRSLAARRLVAASPHLDLAVPIEATVAAPPMTDFQPTITE